MDSQEDEEQMYKVFTIAGQDGKMMQEAREVAMKYPFHMQINVMEAYQAAEEENFEKVETLCRTLLDCAVMPEIQRLLGVSYLMQGKMQMAEKAFSDLTKAAPEVEDYHIHHALANIELRRFEEVADELEKIYPLQEYHPLYYTCYGECLQQLGRRKQSREMFYKEVEFFAETGTVVSPVILDGAFENLLMLDVTLGNGKYPDDIRIYYDFLNQIEMTEEMQNHLASNIAAFSTMMNIKWYQPLFLELITYVKSKGFLSEPGAQETLDSGFTSWESYHYHEDRRISAFTETFLNSSHQQRYEEPGLFSEGEHSRIQIAALTYNWYMCLYAPMHIEEIDYLREQYPYTYADNRTLFEKIQKDAQGTAEEVLDELLKFEKDMNRQRLRSALLETYAKASMVKKEPVQITDGMESYKRIQPKVGRNDPCPCGSGKKYKKCCGR